VLSDYMSLILFKALVTKKNFRIAYVIWRVSIERLMVTEVDHVAGRCRHGFYTYLSRLKSDARGKLSRNGRG